MIYISETVEEKQLQEPKDPEVEAQNIINTAEENNNTPVQETETQTGDDKPPSTATEELQNTAVTEHQEKNEISQKEDAIETTQEKLDEKSEDVQQEVEETSELSPQSATDGGNQSPNSEGHKPIETGKGLNEICTAVMLSISGQWCACQRVYQAYCPTLITRFLYVHMLE